MLTTPTNIQSYFVRRDRERRAAFGHAVVPEYRDQNCQCERCKEAQEQYERGLEAMARAMSPRKE